MSDKKDKKTGGEKGKKGGRKAPTRPPVRDYADSPAGHFADKLGNVQRMLNKIGMRMFGWQGVQPMDTTSINSVREHLEKLASTNYMPPKKKGGAKGVNIVPNTRVYLKQEGIDMLKPQFPNIETLNSTGVLFIGLGCDPNLKVQPIRVNSGDLTAPWVGFVPRNMLSNVLIEKKPE